MTGHDDHPSLPGYDPDQVFIDGCTECEYRSQRPFDVQVAYLDAPTFLRAWVRAAKWHTGVAVKVSGAEAPLLRGLWAVKTQMTGVEGALLLAESPR